MRAWNHESLLTNSVFATCPDDCRPSFARLWRLGRRLVSLPVLVSLAARSPADGGQDDEAQAPANRHALGVAGGGGGGRGGLFLFSFPFCFPCFFSTF